ncbi:MAG: Jag N-terminal domain-containing protein [Bifidobacteriaceae bacterium]|jgi:hypothetical protein|nr:Jag N-terminal domain-containing protein [Bifidobacteriaceae bacterium]
MGPRPNSVTVSAESIEEAVRRGIEQLGASSNQDVIVTVIEEQKKGFMGFGARPAEVTVEKTPEFRQRQEEERRTRVAAAEAELEGSLVVRAAPQSDSRRTVPRRGRVLAGGSSLATLPGLREWWRVAAAGLSQPRRRSMVMAMLVRTAMAAGPAPVRTWERSWSNETSRTGLRRSLRRHPLLPLNRPKTPPTATRRPRIPHRPKHLDPGHTLNSCAGSRDDRSRDFERRRSAEFGGSGSRSIRCPGARDCPASKGA